ncbi:MAG: adenosylcobinamide-GDP ribazoletransferase [Gammaproteobacteria bacterium]|nr:adenosylcobinamide-GDP ribazoletransferase [Gammaproteobacteria bacterium]MBU1656254.1 adenosylcobinamide-GDP ribazoletransferase [Gammaproteobacteria bacterium]MBU1959819.1 adenosylcobinamide-GDP ribazoletransferase [Gammaproteobacteria bacterium]
MRPLWLAFGLLTRLPVPDIGEPGPGEQGRSLLWYPLVGLIIGLLLMFIALLFRAMDHLVVSALLITVWVAITGALHLDGLADSADAWLGSHGDRERALRIMKDPACGPAGVVAISLILLTKFAAVQALLGLGELLPLILAPLLARTMLPLLFTTTDYVRQDGMAASMAAELPKQPLILVLILPVIAVLTLGRGQGLVALLVALAAGCWVRRLMIRHLGGTTGDTAGAMAEIIETAVLLGLVFTPV